MQLKPFALERYFARYEFSARYMLSSSDCESLPMAQLLAGADEEARGLWDRLCLGYTESPGHPLLRAEIARQYKGLQPDQILTAAPEEAIFVAMNAILSAGDRVVTVWPAYQSLHAVASALGCEVVHWPIELVDGQWDLDLDKLAKILPGARLLVLNFPHNPTGFMPTQEVFHQAIQMAEEAGAFIFSDEMYRLLELDAKDRLPPACEVSPRSVSLSGLSKAYGLAGLRTGWLATQDRELCARFQMMKDYTTICGSAPGELLALMALRSREAIVERSRVLVRRNLNLARDFFSAYPDLFAWVEPVGGSTAYPRWVGRQPLEEFCAASVEQAGVMIVPASMFQDERDHFRVGLGRENFEEVISALGAFLQTRR